jgi:hypothetical protein
VSATAIQTRGVFASVVIYANQRIGTDPAVNPRKFFAEVKRRNVYKVAIAYGVVAWLCA